VRSWPPWVAPDPCCCSKVNPLGVFRARHPGPGRPGAPVSVESDQGGAGWPLSLLAPPGAARLSSALCTALGVDAPSDHRCRRFFGDLAGESALRKRPPSGRAGPRARIFAALAGPFAGDWTSLSQAHSPGSSPRARVSARMAAPAHNMRWPLPRRSGPDGPSSPPRRGPSTPPAARTAAADSAAAPASLMPYPALDRGNVLACSLVTAIAVIALAHVTGAAACSTCVTIAAIFGTMAAAAARGWPAYRRARVPLTVALRIAFVALHNLAIVLSAGPRKGQPDPSWRWFWSSALVFVFLCRCLPGRPGGRPGPPATAASGGPGGARWSFGGGRRRRRHTHNTHQHTHTHLVIFPRPFFWLSLSLPLHQPAPARSSSSS